ncbi:esterase-like activity of phytase family protein [Endozoicomonas sp. 4G]|uniref:esterase-like activity of phytase family protein n=1 Tax=Endozoicomonas sp. 4G TaxID=2872754 RepID=UPI0020789D78|nr:esterase-like activity of phytase family protein [Endozoicomonas sp. 4G]
MPLASQKRVTHITGAHFEPADGSGSPGMLYLLSGDAGAGFTGRHGLGVFSKPRYYEIDLRGVKLDQSSSRYLQSLPDDEVFEYHLTEGKHAKTDPLWLNDGHIAPSAITTTKDNKLLISSSQSDRGFFGVIDYRAIDIPAYAGYGYRHANRDETSFETRNNGFLKAWYDAHEFFPVPIFDLIPAAFLHIFREVPIQFLKGVHRFDVGLSSKFLLTDNDRRAGQVDSEFRLPRHFENNNWIPLYRGLRGIQEGLGIKSLDRVPGSHLFVAATAGALVQDAREWTIKGANPPARVVTFTTEQLHKKGEPMPIQYPNSDQLPARGEVSILSEKLYNFSLLVVNPVVRKQLKGDPIRTVSDIAVLNDKYALFLEKTELPFQTSRKTAFVTRVYLVALHSGKNFKDSGAFTDDELNKIFMETPKDFMSKTLLFDSSHKDSLDLMPDNPDFDIHETGFEAIALGPNTSNGDRTFMLVSYDNGESESQKTRTRLLHFSLPAGH